LHTESKPNVTIDASLVNVEAPPSYSSTKFKPEDLREDLREYEERVLKQLEDDDDEMQYEEE
jgi:hypothetical protein